jgi:nitrate reductase gamma subunit
MHESGALEFARGAGLHWSLAIMVFGFAWRLAATAVRRSDRDLHWVRKGFHPPTLRWQIDSYAMHAGMLVAVFGFAPHIVLVRELTGISWPAPPTGVVMFAAVLAIIGMAAALAQRIFAGEPSRFSVLDDYFSWAIVFAALATGIAAYPHLGGAAVTAPYRALLTAHLLCVELLFVWLPFGKLGHVAILPLVGAGAQFFAFLRRKLARSSGGGAS